MQVAQSEADMLRMDLAEAQTTEAALRSTLTDTEGQVRRSPWHLPSTDSIDKDGSKAVCSMTHHRTACMCMC